MYNGWKKIALSMSAPLLFLLLWEWGAVKTGNEIVLPHIESVTAILFHPFESVISMGSLYSNVGVSLVRVLCGYALAVFVAIPLGILMGYSTNVFTIFNGFLGMFRPVPPLAWVPLVLAWFGVASFATLFELPRGPLFYYLQNIKLSMLFIIFVGAFFPILLSAIHGVRSVNKTLVDGARVLGASDRHIFSLILLPAAAPEIVTGMRIGLGVAWMCLISAEMLPGSLSGIGYLITHAYTIGRTDVVIAGMISISVVGAILDMLFQYFERRRYSWRHLAR